MNKSFAEIVPEVNAPRVNVKEHNSLGHTLCRFYGGKLDRAWAWLKLDGANQITFQTVVEISPLVAAMLDLPQSQVGWVLYLRGLDESALYSTGVSRHQGFHFVGLTNKP